MIPVQFPAPNFRIRKNDADESEEIFDPIRKKWLRLTNEEWVRQNFVAYLINVEKISASLIGIEKLLLVGELKKRFDILVFSNDGKPWMLVECKATNISLSEKTISQALSYFSATNCRYILITNGLQTYAWEVSGQNINMLQSFPRSM